MGECKGILFDQQVFAGMESTVTQIQDVPVTGARERISAYVELTKPRIALMLVLTSAAGFYVASAGRFEWVLFANAMVGIGLLAFGVATLNQFLERDTDALMERTRRRPLPDGRLHPNEALYCGFSLACFGLAYLALAVNALTAAVAATITLSYLWAYTPMKRMSSLCVPIGAEPGALPPVIGWVAARGELSVDAWVLFAILFLWQIPHTLAIACLYRDDFAKAGIQFLPVIEPDGESTNRQILVHCSALLAVSLLPTLISLAGAVYFVTAFALGIGFLASGVSLVWTPSRSGARRLLLASLLYLPALLLVMALDRVPL